ncbi:MAG: NAD(P)-dependent oxidoreductase [Pseudomonadota bacterium]
MSSNTEKALIFGGAGFIGTRLARHLQTRDADVTIADLEAPSAGTRACRIDVRQPIPDDLAADADTTIYLLAAVHRTPGHADAEYFATNLHGVRNVVRFAVAHDVRRIVFTSSIAVYGPGEDPKDETVQPEPVSAYGWSKLLAEEVLQDWRAGAADRQLVIARPAVVFGPGEQGNFTRLAAALRRRMFAYPGRRDTIKGCCFVDDLIDSFNFALQAGQPELLYNFAYPEAYTIEAICKAFHDIGGLPSPIGHVPKPAISTLGWSGEALSRIGVNTGVNRARIAKLTRSTHIAPRRLVDMGYRFPTDLPRGLAAWQAEAGSFQ